MSNFTTQNCVCYYYDYEAVSLGRDIAKIVYALNFLSLSQRQREIVIRSMKAK